jgi:hypothetical protein
MAMLLGVTLGVLAILGAVALAAFWVDKGVD